MADYIKEFCPKDYDQVESTWWSNGFIKGYESGVNAPVKKLNCGHDDGVKFVNKVKEKFGESIVWKEDTKKMITDFMHKYLNDTNNVPVEYRGALYRRWYSDSFKRAVKNELAPKVPYEKGKSVEDADNVMKHILARLFEFLYISVYRETTFQEIFNNADPNVFLEAVGITKKDFEVLNKYHIFQENVLNNYIHQFFVNESLGSKLNLEDEEVKRQYRNSFDWFGFGLDETEVGATILEGGQSFIDYIKYQVHEIAEETEATVDKQFNVEKDYSIEETQADSLTFFASLEQKEFDKENSDEETDIVSNLDRIKEVLLDEKRGIKAGKIADLLDMSKKEVNRILYANQDVFISDFFKNWKLK